MTIAVRMLCRLNTHLRKIGKRAAALAATAFTLWLFGESILPLLLHGLQLGIEVVELAFEHLLEWAFGLSRRAAQTITFWTGIFLIAYASLRLVRRACNELRRACDGVRSRLQHWINGRPLTWIGHP